MSLEECQAVSGGLWDGELFLQGLGYAAVGAVAIALSPFVAPALGVGLAVSGGIAGVGGAAIMSLSDTDEKAKPKETSDE